MAGITYYYERGTMPQKYIHKKMCSEETILKRLGRIRNISSTKVSLYVATDGCRREEHIFVLKQSDQKDEFFAQMMRLSLTHWIDRVTTVFGVKLLLSDSKDGQTNITPDVIEAIYQCVVQADARRDARTRNFWKKRGYDGWICGLKEGEGD